MTYPIFPHHKSTKVPIGPNHFKFRFETTVRVLREGLWYDVDSVEEYIFTNKEIETIGESEAKERVFMMFLRKCVLVLTLWKAHKKFLSKMQSHHDQIIFESLKIKK